jgi:hypothetical protein
MKASIQDLKREKERLIGRYIELQDVIDQYNNEIYKVCCEIEAINLLIDGENKKAARKGAVSTNGSTQG